jgi:predicted transporter
LLLICLALTWDGMTAFLALLLVILGAHLLNEWTGEKSARSQYKWRGLHIASVHCVFSIGPFCVSLYYYSWINFAPLFIVAFFAVHMSSFHCNF